MCFFCCLFFKSRLLEKSFHFPHQHRFSFYFFQAGNKSFFYCFFLEHQQDTLFSTNLQRRCRYKLCVVSFFFPLTSSGFSFFIFHFASSGACIMNFLASIPVTCSTTVSTFWNLCARPLPLRRTQTHCTVWFVFRSGGWSSYCVGSVVLFLFYKSSGAFPTKDWSS